ncbi:MAG: serine/threonine protein kinase [Kofleriaceae bacterium]
MGAPADEQTDPRFLVGQVLAGRYWLQEHLGRGAMGDVFRARHAKVPRTFAVKVLHPELVADEKTCLRFEREAELAGRLHHRNVISVIDVGETARSRYLVMEYAEGVSLVDVIAGQPMSTSRVINLAKQICDGLQHAHEHELVHRDLKPENIIVERTGDDEVPRIVDFGLAILRDHASPESMDRLTTRGIVLGTPHFLAPETALGKELDHRIDLFALGVIMYEMMTGVMPFDGDGVEVAGHNLRTPTPAMSVRAPGVEVDPLLEALVHKLLEKKPDDRPQSARETRSILDMIETDRAKAGFVLGAKPGPPTMPLPAGLRSPKVDIRIGDAHEPDVRPTGNGIPLERVSSNELTTRTEDHWFDRPDDANNDASDKEPGTQRDVTTDRVRPREPRTTDELLRAAGSRRREWKIALAAVALLAVVAFFLLRRDHSVDASADVAVDDPIAPQVAMRAVAQEPPPVETVPDPAPVETVVKDVSAPKKQPVQARATTPVEAPVAKEPPKAEDVLALYQSLGRELKKIADRRDMSADDLWVRYRRVRIQDVMTSTTKRAEALAILVAIDREIDKRFRSSGL